MWSAIKIMISGSSSVLSFLFKDIPTSILQFFAGIILVAGIRTFIVVLVLVVGATALVVSQYGTFEPSAPAPVVTVQEVNLAGLEDDTKLLLLKNNTHCKLSGINLMTCTDKERDNG